MDILGLIAHARRNVVGKVNKNKKRFKGVAQVQEWRGSLLRFLATRVWILPRTSKQDWQNARGGVKAQGPFHDPVHQPEPGFFFCITQFASICTPWVDVPCTNAHGNLIKLVTQPMTTYQAPALPWEFGACTKYLKRDTEQQRRPIMSVVHCAGNYSNHCQRLSFLAIHIQDQRFKHGQLLMLPNHPWSRFHPEP